MLNVIVNIIIFALLSLMAGSLFMEYTGLSYWWGALVISFIGVLLYFININLIRFFIKRNTPGVMELDEMYGKPMRDGEYLWEKTAGTATVPKWVSHIGIASYGFILGALILIIVKYN